jgi:dienelactone hydrolase
LGKRGREKKMRERTISFVSQGLNLSAWLFLPDSAARPPVVVMAHGFGATRVLGLRPFAERFVSAGLTCLVFDYRCFGDSEGEPRNLISPRRHVEDWLAAIDFAATLPVVDGKRLGLWGTSFSGGHVLVAAAERPTVKAVVSQVPFVDGLGVVLSSPPLFSLKAVGHGLLDVVGSIVGRRHYVPIVGTPDEFALLNKADCLPGFLSLVPEGSGFDNRAPAAISLALSFYSPISRVAEIRCPILMIVAENDSLIPLKDIEKCAVKIRQVKKVLLPVGHFDVYTGEWFAKVSSMEAEFLAEQLR